MRTMSIPFLARATPAASAFTPASLFDASEDGGWYEPSDLTTMWQDVAATDQMTTAGQTCAQMDDKSGNGNHATQGTAAARMALSGTGPYYLNPDILDDNFSMPLGASFVGDFCLVLDTGPIFGSINTVADTTWLYTKNPANIPSGNIHALIVVNRALTAGEKTDLVAYYAAGVTTTPAASAQEAFSGRTDLIALDTSYGDWTGVTNAEGAFGDCSNMTTVNVSGWTGVTNAAATFIYCNGLTTAPDVSDWTGVTNAGYMFFGCGGLTTSINISSWNPVILTDCEAMMQFISAAGFTQAQYEAALAAWDAGYDLTTVNTMAIDFGSAQYGAGAPATTRALLVAEGWTISDGGPA